MTSDRGRRGVCRAGPVLISGVDVVQHSVKDLDPRDRDIRLSGQFDGGPQKGLNFQRTTRLEILVHRTRTFDRRHLLNRFVAEIGREVAAMYSSQLQELVENPGD